MNKYTITIKGKSGGVYVGDGEDGDFRHLIDGIDCQDNFAEYSDLSDILEYGYMRFEFVDNELWTITEYLANRELTETELKDLAGETQGQWSDGIGEGFEQFPCTYHNDEEVYVSPWMYGQELEVKQELVK
jgi:hypothetical protein